MAWFKRTEKGITTATEDKKDVPKGLWYKSPTGKIIDQDLDFTLTIGENSGLYINGDMLKVDEDFLDLISKLQKFYQKFKSKWGAVLSNRKKTKESPE